MARKLRLFLISVFVILLFGEVWVGFPAILDSSQNEDPAFHKPIISGQVDKHMEGVHFVESKSGNRDWEMFAQSAEGSQSSGEWQLNNVRVLFYSADAVEFTVTGKRGTIDQLTKNLKIEGDVVVSSKNGYTFQTKSAHYEAKDRSIESDDKVRMTAPGKTAATKLVMTGNRLHILVDSQDMHMRGDVQTHKLLDDGRQMELTSDTATASGKHRSLKFSGHVEASVQNTRLEGSEALLQYEQTSDVLQLLDVVGNVRLSDLNKYATADDVQFLPGENEFILKGRPRVVQNNDEITGDQIVFTNGGRKVRVDNMKARVERRED